MVARQKAKYIYSNEKALLQRKKNQQAVPVETVNDGNIARGKFMGLTYENISIIDSVNVGKPRP